MLETVYKGFNDDNTLCSRLRYRIILIVLVILRKNSIELIFLQSNYKYSGFIYSS